jgi:hypothetical protein
MSTDTLVQLIRLHSFGLIATMHPVPTNRTTTQYNIGVATDAT